MTTGGKKEHLRELVAGKNHWNRPLTHAEKALGFLGWHERGYLPHWDYSGLTQLVTFRLYDSMPAVRRGEWQHLLRIEDARIKRKQLEDYLDRGLGACGFRNITLARKMESVLLHFHGRQIDLLAWCVMPNHVHVLLQVWRKPMARLVQSWKRFMANASRAASAERRPPARRGLVTPPRTPARRAALPLPRIEWQRDYSDTFMRDERQKLTAIRYIEGNPVKAGLCRQPADWPASSARFRDQYGRLRLVTRSADPRAAQAE